MFEREIGKLRGMGLFRQIADRASLQGPHIVIGGRRLVNFASNDYLGLAGNGALIAASQKAAAEYGAGGGAARLLAGGTALHEELEREAAVFMRAPAALLFNSGYHANMGAIPAMAGEGGAIFSDQLNHASIIDGCRLSRAETFVYRHADMSHLQKMLEASKAGQKLIVTESVFSMDGDIAPLATLYGLARDYQAVLYVDEAHAIGVLGGGRGGLSHSGLPHQPGSGSPAVIRMGTFSKALGSYGAFVAADAGTIDWLKNTARTFIFSTALPPATAAASMAALKLVDSPAGQALLAKLRENIERLSRGLAQMGFCAGACSPGTPIIPVFFDTVEEALRASAGLHEAGFYAPAIRPPTVKRPRLRLQVSAAHSAEDIDGLLEALAKINLP